jgi:tetratricopeptide (TPR) repeat protein
MFRNPTGVTYLGDNIVVCDSFKKSIVIFEPTEFGKLINEATDYYLNYDYVSAKAVWEKILKLNSNYYLAYAGIGKAQLREGNYEEALKNLISGIPSTILYSEVSILNCSP